METVMVTRSKRGDKPPVANDDDGFDQGGPDGPARLARESEPRENGADAEGDTAVADGDDASPGKGHNWSPDGKMLSEYLETIAKEDAQIEAKMSAAKLACQAHRKAKTTAQKALVKAGYPTEQLATMVAEMKTKKKLENIASKLNDEQKEGFERMRDALANALGSLADTALGRAAIETFDRTHAH